mmetsp:Transcript_3999/g.2961  ORF Transcript_3999/g.2961 Transcript_3999/m.2961 type:complete len:88 (-) Transcript_3999:356-619(-)
MGGVSKHASNSDCNEPRTEVEEEKDSPCTNNCNPSCSHEGDDTLYESSLMSPIKMRTRSSKSSTKKRACLTKAIKEGNLEDDIAGLE